MKGGGEARFEVMSDSGVVAVRRSLDDVLVPKLFTLVVEARDKGSPSESTEAVIQLKVVDKETPIFGQLSYRKELREDAKVGLEIASVQARSPGGADIFYAITQGDPYNQFSIDLKTG